MKYHSATKNNIFDAFNNTDLLDLMLNERNQTQSIHTFIIHVTCQNRQN